MIVPRARAMATNAISWRTEDCHGGPHPELSIRRTPSRNSATRREAYLLQLFRCNPDRAVQWNAGTRQQCREQISLISTGVRQETTRTNGTASLARKDEGQVLPRVLV